MIRFGRAGSPLPAARIQNRKFSTGKILLRSQLLVNCNQQIESVLRRIEKLTISYADQAIAAPAAYWKNNPNAWPVDSLMLGSQTYTKTELLEDFHWHWTQSGCQPDPG